MKLKVELMMLAWMIKKRKIDKIKIQFAKVTPQINEVLCESLEDDDLGMKTKFNRSMESLSAFYDEKSLPRSADLFRRKSLVVEQFFGERVKPESNKLKLEL
jgi:hypothetical protein